ncbi:MAG TPA: class I SAM-dependent methyltransferase [Candidatus Dormibacteraeota bacterium]|nr:class I SAM-dependent methyltransferase [Candidatus Dormibacteraeota bacterium]
MPVNYLHSLLHRVENGWDPISTSYASSYAEFAWNERTPGIVEDLDSRLGGLAGKRVLDLGGGPGQYSILFAQRGADVTWHDISREYQAIAREHAAAARVSINFSIGYLEDASCFSGESFDLLFCRVCWYYGRSDRHLARLVYSLIKPGGVGYIECNTPAFSRPRGWRKVQYWLNEYLWVKIGHPMPPHGRIASLLQLRDISQMTLDYSSHLRDIVIFTKK